MSAFKKATLIAPEAADLRAPWLARDRNEPQSIETPEPFLAIGSEWSFTASRSRGTSKMNDIEEQIRKRAYELWVNAGRPEGRSEEFWHAARAEINGPEIGEEKPAGPASLTRRTRQPSPSKTAITSGRRVNGSPRKKG
jgi:hypothetical protein